MKNWLIRKDPGARKDWRQEEKGMTEDEMVGWHHRRDGHEFGWTPGLGDGQGGLACCSPWGHKESDPTEWLNWTEFSKKGRNAHSKLHWVQRVCAGLHLPSYWGICGESLEERWVQVEGLGVCGGRWWVSGWHRCLPTEVSTFTQNAPSMCKHLSPNSW